MKASDAFPSKYLAAADLGGKQVTVKITHVAADEIGGNKKFILYFAGAKKGMVLNKTNWNNIAKICGDDSDDWTGQEITLFEAMVDFQGETVPAIRVRSPAGRPAKPAPVTPHGDPRTDDDMNDTVPF